jgi:ATP/maltotriose-dependent transcriptional regulator MalT
VPRPRLAQRLDEGRGRGLVLACAPAGYGKTVLAAQQAYARAAEEPFEPTVGRARSLLVNVPALIAIHRGFLAQLRGDADATVAFASQAMAEADEGEWLLSSTARGFLAVGEWLRGQLAEAERTFISSIAEWRAAGLPTLTAWVLYLLGQVQRAQGGLDASARTCRQALEMTAVPGRPPPPAAGPAYAVLPAVAVMCVRTGPRWSCRGTARPLRGMRSRPTRSGRCACRLHQVRERLGHAVVSFLLLSWLG